METNIWTMPRAENDYNDEQSIASLIPFVGWLLGGVMVLVSFSLAYTLLGRPLLRVDTYGSMSLLGGLLIISGWYRYHGMTWSRAFSVWLRVVGYLVPACALIGVLIYGMVLVRRHYGV